MRSVIRWCSLRGKRIDSTTVGMMIIKFHARGRGGGSGPVDYLLGKDRLREGACVLQGKAEEVRELIDASAYAKKYTSGGGVLHRRYEALSQAIFSLRRVPGFS